MSSSVRTRHEGRVPPRLGLRLLLCLALVTGVGCSRRKGATTGPTTGSTPAPSGADFETAGGLEPGVLLGGDLPLGDEAPDIESYRELDASWRTGEGGGAGTASAPGLPEGAAEAFSDVLFAFDSYRLTPEARQQLTRTGAFLVAHPEVLVVIEGHCDSRGAAAYNLALGERRALAVREFLAALRVAPTRLTTVSYGEERPLDARPTEEAYRVNRRAHFRARVSPGA